MAVGVVRTATLINLDHFYFFLPELPHQLKIITHNLRIAFACCALTLPAAVIYQQDFESSTSIPSGFSGAGSIETTGGLSAFGFGSNHLFNGSASATTFTLTGLAAHSSITVAFDLAMWDSIDGGTDNFVFSADSAEIINTLFGNDSFAAGPGTIITSAFTDFAVPNYGQNSGFRDSARSLTLSWQYPNTQTAPDESFGIDNIVISDNNVVSDNAVPEPATLARLALTRRR